METIDNYVGNPEDWARYITNVETRETPFLDWIPVGTKPVNPVFNYQVDKFRAPRLNSHVDGVPWTAAFSGGDQRKRINSVIQWFDHGVSVSKLSQDVTNNPAIVDELANEITKAMKEIAQDMETNFLEDTDNREDDKANGYLTRGVGFWLGSGVLSSALYPVVSGYETPALSRSSTAIASQTEDGIRTILQSIWEETKSSETITAFAGSDLMRLYSDFQFRVTSSNSIQQSTFQRQYKDRTINRTVRRYEGDFMDVELVPTPWLVAITGTANSRKGRGYYLHQSKWELRWNQKPAAYRQPFTGGSYEAFLDTIAMMVCKNPRGEGMQNP
jgi:hypothetical protein